MIFYLLNEQLLGANQKETSGNESTYGVAEIKSVMHHLKKSNDGE